jgi:hypothetical protein
MAPEPQFIRQSSALVPHVSPHDGEVGLVRRSLSSTLDSCPRDGEVGELTIECTANLLSQGSAVHQSAISVQRLWSAPRLRGRGKQGPR